MVVTQESSIPDNLPPEERPGPDLELVVFSGETHPSFLDAQDLRTEIFVDEQGIAIEDDRDGLDADATHGVIYREGTPVGVIRMREIDGDTVKVERVGVYASRRGEGLGVELMDLAEEFARSNGKRITLNAQASVVDWYGKLGYVPEGEQFEEAGIAHQKMTKQL